MSESGFLICAYALDGHGGGRSLSLEEISTPAKEDGRSCTWVHLDRTLPDTRKWLEKIPGLDEVAVSVLLADETRPRAVAHGEGMLINLRGVNLNPGADPEDMVSVRLWVSPKQVITTRRDRLLAIQDLREQTDQGQGPTGPGDFLVRLINRLLDRIAPVIDSMDDEVDEFEAAILDKAAPHLRPRLSAIRRRAISLRRYLAPQRDVLASILGQPPEWFTAATRTELRESADRMLRLVEDLDEIRDRAAVTQEELAGRTAEQMNRTMYVLSLVATVFLPLGLLTGLLGVNVGGIPGADNPASFAIVCAIMAVIAIIEVWFFRRNRWL